MREIVRHRLDELDAKLKEMRRHRRELGAALARWEETGELDGHICGLIEGTNVTRSSPIHQLSGSAKTRKARK